jgi:hypothetical protein
MADKKILWGILALVSVFIVTGCVTISKEPSVLEGYWRFTTTTGTAEDQAAVDEAMENVGSFFVFTGNVYYKGMGVLPHEKGTFVIEGSNIVLFPTHMNTAILGNSLKWSKISSLARAAYPGKTLPYTMDGGILKVVDIGIQQAFRNVEPFFSFDGKGNLVFQFN